MNLDYLNSLRVAEIDQVVAWYRDLFDGRRVLEVGSGTGIQLDRLTGLPARLIGLDLADGTYAETADPRVVTYDGHNIPFPDDSFDVVFSSNVLEHIPHREAFQAEIARVLAPGGKCIHILPTHRWRRWTTLTSILLIPKNLAIAAAVSIRDRRWRLPRTAQELSRLVIGEQHGEFGTRAQEYDEFKPERWRQVFRDTGWHVEAMRPMGLFYEGNTVLGPRLSLARRKTLAQVLGSACELFVLSRPSG